jgi:hypothetical protein
MADQCADVNRGAEHAQAVEEAFKGIPLPVQAEPSEDRIGYGLGTGCIVDGGWADAAIADQLKGDPLVDFAVSRGLLKYELLQESHKCNALRSCED